MPSREVVRQGRDVDGLDGPAVNRAELLAEWAKRHSIAVGRSCKCAELRGLDLCGGELGACLVKLLACVQSFAPPPQSIVALLVELLAQGVHRGPAGE